MAAALAHNGVSTFSKKSKPALNLNSYEDYVKFVKEHNIQIVDAVFVSPDGLWQHCSFIPDQLDAEAFTEGLPFDASSIRLFRSIEESDMLMVPDIKTAWVDPFHKVPTLHFTCTIHEPLAADYFNRCPRAIAQKALTYLKSTGIADEAYFGPEAEFFIFDDVRYHVGNHSCSYIVDAHEGYWNTDKTSAAGGNLAHRPGAKQWYFPVSPIDTTHDIRSEMLLTMGQLGVPVEKHHHEVATAQVELGARFASLVDAADDLMVYKYVVRNVAKKHGKSACFLPKPIYGDNGSGMHVHQSLWKDGKPLFAGDKHAGLSELGLNYIGGILKHAPALLAICNPTTNSYKRLVPGFEAPVNLVYSSGNRSAAIRIPMYHPTNPKLKRMEFRCPDPTCNPYLAFAACLLAGLDGIKTKANPGEPLNQDIYELPEEKKAELAQTPATLDDALSALESDMDFLLQGGVFTKDFLQAYIAMKRAEIKRLDTAPHPLEYEMYYHL